MSDVIERATSGRAKCRACGRTIPKGELRFGERVQNPFGEGEATWWFHLRCAACKRPEPALAAIEMLTEELEDRATLVELARHGVEHPRLARVARVEHASSGRARCRHCREPIAKGEWRVALDWWEEGRFTPSGFIHTRCAGAYLGTTDDLEARLRSLLPELADDEVESVIAAATPA